MSFWQDADPKVCTHTKQYTHDGFNFICKLGPHEHDCNAQIVYIKVSTCKSNQDVGYLTANLLRRRSLSFYTVADGVSDETYELATLFCEHGGKATRVTHPKLQDESPNAVYGGGFLHLDIIEVKPSFRGRDIGIIMVHIAFSFLGDRWTLAVMMPKILNDCFLKWNESTSKPDSRGFKQQSEREAQLQKDQYYSSLIKLQRHFGRMGFLQAHKSRNGCNKLFLTRELYYKSNGKAHPWVKKKDALALVDVFVPPSEKQCSGIDKLLLKAIYESISTQRTSKLEKLVRRGASIDNIFGIHVAVEARGSTKKSNKVLTKLIELGAGVNIEDEDGNRALHVAAGQFNVTDVLSLLAAGAKLQAENNEGHTALDVAVLKKRDLRDFSLALDGGKQVPIEMNVIPPYETIYALMDSHTKEKLSEGWLSPRMRQMILTTAELEGDELREDILRYVPADAMQNYSGRSHSKLFAGFEYCFKVLGHVLRYGMLPPTVEHANKMVNHYPMDRRRSFDPFLDEGGRFEFVIDALLDITENEFDWEIFGEDVEAHIETPFDEMFDLARFMLINQGGGFLEGRGPYELSANDVSDSCYGGPGRYDRYADY